VRLPEHAVNRLSEKLGVLHISEDSIVIAMRPQRHRLNRRRRIITPVTNRLRLYHGVLSASMLLMFG